MKHITKQVGIYMDHESAKIIDLVNPENTKPLHSNFTHQVKEDALSKNENLMHNKEQHQQADFYKGLSEIVRHYDDVLLFGPTNAKNEFLNTIKDNHLFSKIRFEIKSADKLSDKEQTLFVEDYFLKVIKPIQ